MSPIILAILMGILAGILRAILGYCKNSEDETFNWGKLLKTIVTMGALGFVIGLFSPNWLTAFALSFTGGVAVNDLINTYLAKSE